MCVDEECFSRNDLNIFFACTKKRKESRWCASGKSVRLNNQRYTK